MQIKNPTIGKLFYVFSRSASFMMLPSGLSLTYISFIHGGVGVGGGVNK